MYLITKTNIPKKADKPITCYKVLLKNKNVYMSPYQRVPFSKAVIDRNMKIEDDAERNVIELSSEFHVTSGYFHSFMNKDDASCDIPSSVLCKCEIPKGVEYFSGKTDSGFKGYASRLIKFLEIV